MEIKTLQNPPIKEAIVEIRFNPNKNVTLNKLEEFAQSIADKYVEQERVENQSIKVVFEKGQEPKHDVQVQPSGIKLKNAAGNRVIIAAIDRFVMSFHAPYTPWPSLKDSAKEFYGRYLDFALQTEITRIGMRYINSIKFPLTDNFQFEDYIRTMPPLPKYEGLPEGLSKFETLVVMPMQDINCSATVRQLLGGKKESDGSSFLDFTLDIDIYEVDAITDIRSEKIWDSLDIMRNKKNAIFFGSLTDKAIALYE